jgi:hypothetical protein
MFTAAVSATAPFLRFVKSRFQKLTTAVGDTAYYAAYYPVNLKFNGGGRGSIHVHGQLN